MTNTEIEVKSITDAIDIIIKARRNLEWIDVANPAWRFLCNVEDHLKKENNFQGILEQEFNDRFREPQGEIK